MSHRSLLAAGAAAFGLALSASAALAASKADSWFTCQTWTPSKASPPVTNCTTWTRTARDRMRSDCDRSTMSQSAMRERCKELSTGSSPAAPPAHG